MLLICVHSCYAVLLDVHNEGCEIAFFSSFAGTHDRSGINARLSHGSFGASRLVVPSMAAHWALQWYLRGLQNFDWSEFD